MAAGSGYRFGDLVLNLDRGYLQKDGADLALRPKAFEVLRYLVERAGRLATKDELVQAVWPNVIVSDDSLAQCIRDIRKVLNDEGERFLRTVPRRGYMFVAETVPFDGSQSPAPATRPAGLRTLPRPAIAVLAGLAILIVGLAAWSRGWLERQLPATGARLTIAVLPFTSLGDKPGEDWLGDGIAEDIMTAVSRFRDLAVIGRNSSFRYRGDAVDVRQAAKDLGAHYVLQGTVRRSADRLRITVQLIDPQTGASRWTGRYDRPFSDVFAIQDEVASKVTAQLVAHAREATIARGRARAPADSRSLRTGAARPQSLYDTRAREREAKPEAVRAGDCHRSKLRRGLAGSRRRAPAVLYPALQRAPRHAGNAATGARRCGKSRFARRRLCDGAGGSRHRPDVGAGARSRHRGAAQGHQPQP